MFFLRTFKVEYSSAFMSAIVTYQNRQNTDTKETKHNILPFYEN